MKLRIRPQMITGFLIMSAILMAVCIFAILFTNRMQTDTTRILAENVSSLKSAEELEIALMDMKGLIANYLLDSNSHWIETFEEKQSTFLYWLKEAREKSHTEEEKAVLTDIQKLFTGYIEDKQTVIRLYQQDDLPAAIALLTLNMREVFYRIYDKCESVLTINERIMNQTNEKVKKDNRTVNAVMIGISIFGVLAGLTLGLVFARKIMNPIHEMVLTVKGATGVDFVEKMNIEDESEFEHLNKYLRKLIQKIHEANKDLEQSQDMLIQSERLASLGRMAAGVAHEIRNPLTAIKMLIFSLQKELSGNDQTNKDFSVIIEEIERIEKFLQTFLDFARPPKPDYSMIDMDELIGRTLHLLSPQLKSGKIVLKKNFQSKDIAVWGDDEQLKMVLINLILNAIQSMPKGGTLLITTGTETLTGKQNTGAKIDIIDTGSGIPEAIINTLFDPFVSRRETGTGLGLSVAYQIVSNHNGWIEAKNNAENGATFTIHLPLRKRQAV